MTQFVNEPSPSSHGSVTVHQTMTLRDALASIESAGVAATVVIDGGNRVTGVLTDGDVRRALLAGAQLSDPIFPYISRDFLTARLTDSRAAVLDVMLNRGVSIIPVVDDELRLLGTHTLARLVSRRQVSAPVLVLAGGRGTRLEHLTETTPKPMLRVAGRPVLERIIDQLVGCGFRDVCLSVSYRAEQITSYFGSGQNFGCQISYLHDAPGSPRGTGGPLIDLIRARRITSADSPVLIVNGDTLDSTDFAAMLSHHETQRHAATVLSADFAFRVPYGVLHVDGERLRRIEEKPIRRERVNAGAYVINAGLAASFHLEGEISMTDIITEALKAGALVGVFAGSSDWVDIGTPEELARARGNISTTR